MLFTRVSQDQPCSGPGSTRQWHLWGWHLAAAASPTQPCRKRWPARACRANNSSRTLSPLPSHRLSAHPGWQHAQRGRCISRPVDHRRQGDVRANGWLAGAGERLGEGGCWAGGFHLQYQAHKTPGTCTIQIKETQKRWKESDRVRTNSAIPNA